MYVCTREHYYEIGRLLLCRLSYVLFTKIAVLTQRSSKALLSVCEPLLKPGRCEYIVMITGIGCCCANDAKM
jgi:hypothetical protein